MKAIKKQISTALFSLFVFSTALGQATDACVKRAVDSLRRESPTGYGVWAATKAKDTFKAFVECDSEFFFESLATAVHETVHMIRGERNAYRLVSGELLQAPSDVGYFAPKKTADAIVRDLNISESDIFFSTYLSPRGSSSSSKDEFSYLLDELNAYTVDLKVLSELASHGSTKVNPQSHGLPALMAYVAYYVQFASRSELSIWRKLKRDPTMIASLRSLWFQAVDVLDAACESPHRGQAPHDTKTYVTFVCTPPEALTQVVGKVPSCAKACRFD